MTRRPGRSEHLTDSEIEAIVLAALPLRQAMLKCFITLKPFNETYALLSVPGWTRCCRPAGRSTAVGATWGFCRVVTFDVGPAKGVFVFFARPS